MRNFQMKIKELIKEIPFQKKNGKINQKRLKNLNNNVFNKDKKLKNYKNFVFKTAQGSSMI